LHLAYSMSGVGIQGIAWFWGVDWCFLVKGFLDGSKGFLGELFAVMAGASICCLHRLAVSAVAGFLLYVLLPMSSASWCIGCCLCRFSCCLFFLAFVACVLVYWLPVISFHAFVACALVYWLLVISCPYYFLCWAFNDICCFQKKKKT